MVHYSIMKTNVLLFRLVAAISTYMQMNPEVKSQQKVKHVQHGQRPWQEQLFSKI